jgi:two-component system chemotaxis response regulator CheB
MPEMDGPETLKAIDDFNNNHPERPAVKVIIVSAFTQKGADVTIDALEQGAVDFITKSQGVDIQENKKKLYQQLAIKINQFITERLTSAIHRPAFRANRPPVYAGSGGALKQPYEALVIAVSTGGPKALSVMLPALSEVVSLPIFIVQHMPPTFTDSLARSLNKHCRHEVIEAQHGLVVKEKWVYIAPGGQHMAINRNNQKEVVIATNTQPPVNGCRPSADILFRSAATVYGGGVIAVVLTGMGSDGAKELGTLKKGGAHILAQDKSSSVVWGMPSSAVASGYVDAILPLLQMPATIQDLIEKRNR